MDPLAVSVEEQIKQLGDARKLVLNDSTYYPTIIQAFLPIIAPPARVELRRWGADFLAETFASPTIAPQEKENLSLIVLETLKSMIEDPHQDTAVVKSVVQTAASIYPLVFRHTINNFDGQTWDRMLAIKSRILRIWDTAAPGVRVCCIKFAQRVVLVQTSGPDADPRRGDPLEVSLTMVPPNHPLIPPRNLEAEASGLLDRMLAVFQENISDAVLVDATLNSLSILIRARPHIASKILNVILNFNPLKQANSPMTPKLRVMVKSMERLLECCLFIFLSGMPTDPQNPLAPKIQQYVERMMRSRSDIFDEISRKRGPPEPTDGLDATKRQKLGAQMSTPRFHVPPLTPGSHTIAELYTVTTDDALKAFDVSQLSEDLVVKIGITILQRIDADTLNQAIEGIRQRYASLSPTQPELLNPETAPLGVDEDDDDYEPDFFGAEDTEQILNKLDSTPFEEPKLKEAPDMALGHFALPPAPPLTFEQATQDGQGTVLRVFGVMQTLDPGKKSKAGMNRLAASAYDRDAWITIITRLATRASAGLEEPSNAVKIEPGESTSISLSNTIRESLYLYILEDFRTRMDIAMAWLCEEWYNDRIQMKLDENAVLNYEKWVLKVLDGILPYLDGTDRLLIINFLSEIPGLNPAVLERVKALCRDPATVNIALQSLLFLVSYRQPVRELVLNAVDEVWDTYEDARPVATKLFGKWRPSLAERGKTEEAEEKKTNGDAITAAA